MATDTTKNRLIIKRVFHGAIANYVGQFVTLGTGFLLTPFILHRLGASSYGLWALVGSLIAYSTLFDFGVSGAVIKYVAEYHTRGEYEQAHGLIATALRLYIGFGLVLIALSATIAPIFPDLFNVPPAERATASWLVLLAGVGIGISLPCATPAAVLRGLQRYDLVNLISVSGTLLVATATIVILLLGGGVIGMAAVNIPLLLLMQIPGIWLVNRIAPELRYGWRGASRRFVRTVIGYSSSIFITQASARVQTKTDEIVIGAFLPVAAVAPYAVARRLSEIAGQLTNQFMKVLLPLASELHAENDQARLRVLFITGTRLSLAIFLPIGGTLIVLARSLLTVWIGAAYAPYAHIVIILTLASLIDTSLWPAGSVLQGMGRFRPLAIMSLAAAVVNLALSIILVLSVGITGVALGTLIPTILFSFGLALPYAMRSIGVTAKEALTHIFLPALLPAAPMTITLYALDRMVAPASLFSVAGIACIGLLVYMLGYLGIGANELERQICHGLALNTIRFARTHLRRS